MNIALIYSEALHPINGANIRGNYLLDLLSKKGHNVDLITPKVKISFPPNINPYYVSKVERFTKFIKLKHLWFGLKSFTFLNKLKKKYDVIYCFGVSGTTLAYLLTLKTNVPLICDFTEMDFLELYDFKNPLLFILKKISPMWNKKIFSKCKKLIVLTKEMQKYVTQNSNVDTEVIYDAADYNLFNAKVKKTRDEGFVLVFHGGIEKRDGILNLLKASRNLLRRYDFKILIIGKGGAKKECMNYVRKHFNLKKSVTFTGWVPYSDVPKYLSKASVGVVPSIDIPLNRIVIPRKIFEYMNCGIPILASDLPAIREVLNEKNSILVPPNINSLTQAIKFCIENPKVIKKKARFLIEKAKVLNLQHEMKKLYKILVDCSIK